MIAPISCTNSNSTQNNPPIRTYTTTPAVNSDTKYFSQYTQNGSYYNTNYTHTEPEINYSHYLYSESEPHNSKSSKRQNRLSLLDDNDLIEKTAQLINKQYRMKILNMAQKDKKNLNSSLPVQTAPEDYMDKLKLIQQQVEKLQFELRQKQFEQEQLQKKIQEHLIQTNFYSINPTLEEDRQNLRFQQEQIRQSLEQKISLFNQYQNQTPSQPRSMSYDKNYPQQDDEVFVSKQRSSSHAPILVQTNQSRQSDTDSRRISRADLFYQTRPQDQEISAEYKKVLEHLIRDESMSHARKNVSQESKMYEKSATVAYNTQVSLKPSEPRKITLNNSYRPSFTDSGVYDQDSGLYLSKTEKSLELKVDDDRNYMFERYLREIQMKRRLEEEKMREKEIYERKLMEAKQIEEKIKREQELREKEALEQKLREKERLELELRQEQMKEKLRREQEQREKEALERKLKEKELIEQKLLAQQMKEKIRMEQEARERQNLEKILREEKLKAAEWNEKQKKEQEMLQRQLKEKELIEKELREQQLIELREKEVLTQKLKEKELNEQRKKEQQKMKEKLKKEKKQKLKNQENRLQINIEDFKRLEFPLEEDNSIFFEKYLKNYDPQIPSLSEDEIEIKDFSERLPKNYLGEFNLRRKVITFSEEDLETEKVIDKVVELATDFRPSNKLSSLVSSNVEVIMEEEEEEAQREYLEMLAYSKLDK